MRRVFKLELKRVLKARITWVFALAAIALSLLMAANMVGGERINDRELNKLYTGLDAVQMGHRIDAPSEGMVLPERLVAANEAYVELVRTYGSAEAIPEDIYRAEVWPLRRYVNLVGEVMPDPATGITIPPEERTTEDIEQFYQNRAAYIEQKLAEKELKNDPVGLQNALRINAQVQQPFCFQSFRGWDSGIEGAAILTFLIILLCTAITAPTFSQEYQTGADSILRCTRHGRGALAVAKIGAALLVSALLYLLCMGIYLGLLCALLGTAGLATSVQMIFAAVIAPLAIGELAGAVVLCGLLTLLATVCFTLFVSSRCKAPMITLVVAVVMVLLPTFMRVLADGNVALWIRFCLPSGGTGFGNSIFYELMYNTNFLRIGGASIWSPYVMVGAAVVGTVVFLLMGVRSYKKYEAV